MDVTSRMLPTELVAKILQRIPDQPRLNSCALVCRSWHNAAVTATKCLVAQLSQQKQLDSLNVWLQRQGTGLKVLSIGMVNHLHSNHRSNCITLPLEQLRHLSDLHLEFLAPNFSHGDCCSPAAQSLSGLTSLQLVDVAFPSYKCAELLTQLTSLRHLQLSNVSARSNAKGTIDGCIQSTLRTSSLLTSLVFSSGVRLWGDSYFEAVDNLTQLQQLQVSAPFLSVATVNQLPHTLTRLEFTVHSYQLAPSTTPRLAELTRLRHLAIRGKGHELVYDPRLLASLLQLQHLDLHHCRIPDEAGVAALLGILPELQQLQHLSLAQSLYADTQAERYTALVSSNQLTHLDLVDCGMPVNAVYHIFAANRQYPRLETFRVGRRNLTYISADIPMTVCAGALGRLVSCCFNLREVFIGDTLDPDCAEDLTALKQLAALEKLGMTGDAISDASIGALVDSDLPALRDLEVNAGLTALGFQGLGITGEGALYLRKLTQLTRLCIESSGMERCTEFVDEAGLCDLRKRIADALKDNGDVAKVLLNEQKNSKGILSKSAMRLYNVLRKLNKRCNSCYKSCKLRI